MRTFKIEFFSSFREVSPASDKVLDFLTTKCCIEDKELLSSINFALRELLINAVEHGNRMDEKRKVYCEVCIDNGEIFIHVLDEGDGFEFKNYRKSARPQDLLRERGRGLYIIEKLGFRISVDKNHVMVRLKIDEIL